MLDCLFLHLRRCVWGCAAGAALALVVVGSLSSAAMAGKSIFDDQPTNSTEKPAEPGKPPPRPVDTSPPRPAWPIPPAPATSPAPIRSASDVAAEKRVSDSRRGEYQPFGELIKELFTSEFADHTPAGRRALAATLLKNVDKNSDDPSRNTFWFRRRATWPRRPETLCWRRKPTVNCPNAFASHRA